MQNNTLWGNTLIKRLQGFIGGRINVGSSGGRFPQAGPNLFECEFVVQPSGTQASGTVLQVLIPPSQVPAGARIYVKDYQILVNGASAWTGASAALAIAGTDGTALVTAAVAALTGNAYIRDQVAAISGVTLVRPFMTTASTVATPVGLDFRVTGATITPGSPVVVYVRGYIAP
jgi:hypothetical protein